MNVRGTAVSLSMGLALWMFTGPEVEAGEPEIPRDVLKGIEAMKALPVEGFQVVQTQGRVMLVSTNGHYVVTGRILDLWNQIEVHSVADVDKTERIPLGHLGLTAQQLGGVSVGRSEAREAVTVFLDPASPQSQELLPALRELSRKRRVDLVFVPAQSSRAGTSQALICHHEAATAFFETTRLPDPMPGADPCGAGELQRAQVTIQLLGIRTLPLSIAPNGVTVAGAPPDYARFIAGNQE